MDVKLKKILIVEDDVSFKDMLESYILSYETEVEVVSVSSINGLVLEFNAKQPDLIFLDVIIPGISGIEILKFLKQLKCESKIFVMSGFSGVMENAPVEADGYLEKPFDLDEIGKIISDL